MFGIMLKKERDDYYMKDKGQFQEWPDDKLCPCGSGKVYGECCKKKSFSYGMSERGVIKKVPLSDEAMDILDCLKSQFREYYGRDPKEEYLLSFIPIYNDRFLISLVNMLKKAGIPEEMIYATYKMDGLVPFEDRLDQISEQDLQEYEEWCEAYRTAVNGELQHTTNALQYVVLANSYLEDNLDYTNEALISCLNDYIRRHSGSLNIREFEMKTEKDYCMFSALKTIKTIESIRQLREINLPECIYALARSIFENYMYLCAINGKRGFFDERLLPRIDKENYCFAKKKDGSVNYRKIIYISTGKIQDAEVGNAELKKYLFCSEDQEIYGIFYRQACQYVHVDVLSAKSYFSVVDPYDEVNPTLIAELITDVLAVMLLDQLRRNPTVGDQFREDAKYLCGQLYDKLASCLEIARTDPEHQNAVLDLLVERLKVRE